MRALTLTLAAVLGAAALALMVLSLYWADDLADWRLPGLAALAAIACNVMLMTAAQVARPGTPVRPGRARTGAGRLRRIQ